MTAMGLHITQSVLATKGITHSSYIVQSSRCLNLHLYSLFFLYLLAKGLHIAQSASVYGDSH